MYQFIASLNRRQIVEYSLSEVGYSIQRSHVASPMVSRLCPSLIVSIITMEKSHAL